MVGQLFRNLKSKNFPLKKKAYTLRTRYRIMLFLADRLAS
jgi:hypothetical protein